MLVIGQIVYHSIYDYGIVCDIQIRSVSVYFKDKRKRTFIMDLRNDSSYLSKVNNINLDQVINLDLISGLFDERTKQKGYEINNSDKILNLKVKDDQVSALIQGSIRYSAYIYIEDGIVKFQCDCPVQGLCKHLFALYLTVKNKKSIDILNENMLLTLTDRFAKFPKYDWDLLDNIINEINELETIDSYFRYVCKFQDEDFLNYIFYIFYSNIKCLKSLPALIKEITYNRKLYLISKDARNDIEKNKYPNPYYNRSGAEHLLYLLANQKYDEMFEYIYECSKFKHLFRVFDDEFNALKFVMKKINLTDTVLNKFIQILKAFNYKDVDSSEFLKSLDENKLIEFCSENSTYIKINEDILECFDDGQLLVYYSNKNDIKSYLTFVENNFNSILKNYETILISTLVQQYLKTQNKEIINFIYTLKDNEYLLMYLSNAVKVK